MAPSYFGSRGVVSLTREITVTAGFHVVVGRLTAVQQDECAAILQGGSAPKVRTVAKGRAGSSEVSEIERVTEVPEDYRRYQVAVVARAVRSWDLTEEDGSVAAVDEAHVRQLLDADKNAIFLAVSEWDRPLSEKEQGE